MATVSQAVQKIINKRIFLQEAMRKDIVSHTKLAKNLQPEIEKTLGKTVTTSAIIMALRRHTKKLEKLRPTPTFKCFIENIKTDIFYIVVKESPHILNKIRNFCDKINFEKGGILNIIQGNHEIAVITNSRYKDKLLDTLNNEKILNTLDNMIAISLTYSQEYLLTPGVLYDVLRLLAWENINVVDIILTQTELSLIIKKEDMMKCYDILERFTIPSEEIYEEK